LQPASEKDEKMNDSAMIIDALFKTGAIRVCDPDHPFWYTSGTLGPYYINTHFLFGGETAATALLSRIETYIREDPVSFPGRLLTDLQHQYAEDDIYKKVMDALARAASGLPADFLSGGERRDFYFSLLLADLLGKPHLSIFKTGGCVLSTPHVGSSAWILPDPASVLAGQDALHAADIVTKAASYTRAWLPVVRSFGAGMPDTLVVIDRQQGGREALAAQGVTLHALADVDDTLFISARDAGILSQGQMEMVREFNAGPLDYMAAFLKSHPDFIRQELAAGGKSRERALLCISEGFASAPDPSN
jgi:orotate phosphoribosyltransferase